MPLVSENTQKNAEKCKSCAFLKLKNMDKTDVLYDEAQIAVEGVIRASCAMCPYSKDFEAVYGMKPYEYFAIKR